jgi:hypothetical protein
MSSTPDEVKKQHFISFRSKYIGKILKIRIKLNKLRDFAIEDKDGNLLVDIFIAKRKDAKPDKSQHIAWVELDSDALKDNTDKVEKIFGENDKK